MTHSSAAIRDLTKDELLKVGGGQDVPVSNLTIQLSAGQCRNLTNGDDRREVCATAGSTSDAWDFWADIVPVGAAFIVFVCTLCGTRINYRAYVRERRLRQVQ